MKQLLQILACLVIVAGCKGPKPAAEYFDYVLVFNDTVDATIYHTTKVYKIGDTCIMRYRPRRDTATVVGIVNPKYSNDIDLALVKRTWELALLSKAFKKSEVGTLRIGIDSLGLVHSPMRHFLIGFIADQKNKFFDGAEDTLMADYPRRYELVDWLTAKYHLKNVHIIAITEMTEEHHKRFWETLYNTNGLQWIDLCDTALIDCIRCNGKDTTYFINFKKVSKEEYFKKHPNQAKALDVAPAKGMMRYNGTKAYKDSSRKKNKPFSIDMGRADSGEGKKVLLKTSAIKLNMPVIRITPASKQTTSLNKKSK